MYPQTLAWFYDITPPVAQISWYAPRYRERPTVGRVPRNVYSVPFVSLFLSHWIDKFLLLSREWVFWSLLRATWLGARDVGHAPHE